MGGAGAAPARGGLGTPADRSSTDSRGGRLAGTPVPDTSAFARSDAPCPRFGPAAQPSVVADGLLRRAREGSVLRLRCIACETFARPLYRSAAESRHLVDVRLLRLGLHDTPGQLRERLQEEIAAASRSDAAPDAIVLAYGLCGGATAGIEAVGVPLVLPRAHDCITMFLGSRERYAREFTSEPGTYWYTADYLERGGSGASLVPGLGARSDEQLRADRERYVERFGEDNAAYLMEVMGAWRDHYDRAAFIDMGTDGSGAAERAARAEAARRSWRFQRLEGDRRLLRRLLDGAWDDDFLVLAPGERLSMSTDDSIVRATRG